VVAVAIMACVSIPQYQGYRDRRHDGAAKERLREVAPAIDAYFAGHGTYAGMTLTRLQAAGPSRLDASGYSLSEVSSSGYCVQASVSGRTWHESGPMGELERGACPAGEA
jgi:Tfp pilus assembly protein PilE